MIIQLDPQISEADKTRVSDKIQEIGYKANEVHTQMGHYLVAIGKKDFDPRKIGSLSGVLDIHRLTDPSPLFSPPFLCPPPLRSLFSWPAPASPHSPLLSSPFSLSSSPPLSPFPPPPPFYTARFSLRQRPPFLYCPFLVAAAPLLFILPVSRCGSAPLFILPVSRCGSPQAFFTYHFSLRQHPRFLYYPFLVAAAPRLFILPVSRCGSAPLLFILPISCCGSALTLYTYQFSLRQHPRFLYCPFLVAAAPLFLYCPILVAAAPQLFILPISRCGSAPAFYTARFSLRQRPRFFY